VKALVTSGRISALEQIRIPLLVMALIALATLIIAHRLFL
jgi:hypothetical protein